VLDSVLHGWEPQRQRAAALRSSSCAQCVGVFVARAASSGRRTGSGARSEDARGESGDLRSRRRPYSGVVIRILIFP
jgi:hypothetical protein